MSIRKAEYDRIARENQAIMQRILKRESNFNRATLEAVRREDNKTLGAPQISSPTIKTHRPLSLSPSQEWKDTCRYLENISEYKFVLGKAPPTPKRRLPPIEAAPPPPPAAAPAPPPPPPPEPEPDNSAAEAAAAGFSVTESKVVDEAKVAAEARRRRAEGGRRREGGGGCNGG